MCLAQGRQTPSTEVDHSIPHGGDEELFWHGEYQALCKPCHSRKTWYEVTNLRRLPKNIRPKSNNITLLFGSPCSGKTTWAKKQSAKVIDFDDIKRTISGHDPYDMPPHYIPTCIAVRNQMIENTSGYVIIIGTLADPRHREDWINKLKAKPLMMITPEHKCIKRLRASNRPNIPAQVALIKRWFAEFRPLGNEEFVS